MLSPLPVPKPPRVHRLYVAVASVAVVAIVAGLWAWRARQGERAEAGGGATISTAKVERRTFVHTLRLSGTLEAVHSYSVLAPRLTGGDYGEMILTKLTRGGTRVKKGDLLAEFDREAQLKAFMDKQAEYRDLGNQIESKKAEQQAARAHDDTELKQAEDAVGTARLEVQRSEVVSRIDAEKNKLNLEAAEAEIEQGRAQAKLPEEQDLTDLEKARYDVQRAKLQVSKAEILSTIEGEKNKLALADAEQHLKEEEEKLASDRAKAAADYDGKKQKREKALLDAQAAELDVSKNELVSAIDGKKNLLALEEAKRHLTQLEQDIKSHSVSNQAALDVALEKERKARLLMAQAESNIQSMSVKTTIEGLVSLKENMRASGGFVFSGMKLPEFREGDQVGPGTMVAEVMDLEQMEILCKVDEADRANMNAGAPVEAHVDALPGRIFPAKVETVAGTASRGMPWSGNTTSKFDITIGLNKPDPEIRPGLTVQAIVEGGQTNDLLLVPPQALFDKDGKPFAYVEQGGNFVARPVKVTRRTESQVAIEGLGEGTVVALVNPEQEAGKPGSSGGASQPSLIGGGGR